MNILLTGASGFIGARIAEEMRTYSFRKLGRVIRSFRLEYYQHVKDLLSGKKGRWPCYAGFASAQIMPDGQVWACCIKGQPLGNLAETDYDFRRVWFSSRADEIRRTKDEPLPMSSCEFLIHQHAVASTDPDGGRCAGACYEVVGASPWNSNTRRTPGYSWSSPRTTSVTM